VDYLSFVDAADEHSKVSSDADDEHSQVVIQNQLLLYV